MKESLLAEIQYAFEEYLVTTGMQGKVSKGVAKAMFEDFKKSIEWRIDNLLKKYETIPKD